MLQLSYQFSGLSNTPSEQLESSSWLKLINVTWVSTRVESTQPSDEELFGDLMKN
jgi:hypothetical protein